MHGEPQAEHRWLRRLMGEWVVEAPSTEARATGEPLYTGTETARCVGDVWVVCEGRMELLEHGTAINIMTLGYDPARQKVVGSWIGSMMTHMWTYEGTIDTAADTVTLDTRGPALHGTGITDYQDVIAFEGGDARTLTSRSRQPDGSWKELFVVRYRRVA